MSDSIPFILAGQRQWRAETLPVTDPYDGGLVARVSVPGGADVEEALAAAQAARRDGADLSSATRAAALGHISQRLAQRRDEVTDLIVREAGKPWKWAAAEAERAVLTFRWAAEEARRLDGEVLRLDTDAALGQRLESSGGSQPARSWRSPRSTFR